MVDTSKYRQNGVGDTKMSSKLYRIQPYIRHSRKPLVAIIHIFARFFEVQLGWHGGEEG